MLIRPLTLALLLLTTLAGAASPRSPRWSRAAETAIRAEHADTVPVFHGFADLTFPDSLPAPAHRTLTRVDLLRIPVFDDYRHRPFPGIHPLQAPSRAAALIDSAGTATQWLAEAMFVDSLNAALKQNFMINYPQYVHFNVRELPEPPKKYHAVMDPSSLIIVMEEVLPGAPVPGAAAVEKRQIDWLNNLDASLQFSQAYISPNWYQGGNNALSMLAGITHTIALNQKFHPKVMFENTTSYKLAISSTPDDSLRKYSITEDLLQITTKAGLRAFKYWFYSVTLNFKTQLLNSYPVNSNDIAASFLSPGQLNVGLGMTYDYTRPGGRFKINASISPLAWDLTTCINKNIDPEKFGIDAGHRTKSKIGSSSEIKVYYALTRDISINSRIFAFTDYTDAQMDWENTIDFAINRFLSTHLYMHLRYDSTSPRYEDSRWHRWQFKEILSLGFSYKFSSI